jgi:hypothetical protein
MHVRQIGRWHVRADELLPKNLCRRVPRPTQQYTDGGAGLVDR